MCLEGFFPLYGLLLYVLSPPAQQGWLLPRSAEGGKVAAAAHELCASGVLLPGVTACLSALPKALIWGLRQSEGAATGRGLVNHLCVSSALLLHSHPWLCESWGWWWCLPA